MVPQGDLNIRNSPSATAAAHLKPLYRTIGGVQQDGGLADDPALVSAEADAAEPIVEALIARRLQQVQLESERLCSRKDGRPCLKRVISGYAT